MSECLSGKGYVFEALGNRRGSSSRPEGIAVVWWKVEGRMDDPLFGTELEHRRRTITAYGQKNKKFLPRGGHDRVLWSKGTRSATPRLVPDIG